MRVAIYARVSTFDQEPENQLAELRQYVTARGWTSVEYVDRGVSGIAGRRSINSSPTPGAASSMCFCAGGSIASAAISGTSSCCSRSSAPSVWRSSV